VAKIMWLTSTENVIVILSQSNQMHCST
jgi:hypothetical protein